MSPSSVSLLLLLSMLLAPVAAAADEPRVKESSGLAVGSDGLIWTHSDGPNIGERVQDRNLYALNAEGAVVRTAKLGVRNDDWEALASFLHQGKRHLLIADVGDNLERRSENQLYVVEEPAGETAPIAWKIRFRYPDKPHDCEAVAVDAKRGRVILVTKRDPVSQIYAVALQSSDPVQMATRLGHLQPLPKAPLWAMVTHPLLAPYAHQPTGMDISPDGGRVAIVTYAYLHLWQRGAKESLEQTLMRAPDQTLSLPGIRQYEGVAFAPEGDALFVSEEGKATLRRVELTP